MTDLITRIEAGTGADRVLTIDICEALKLAPLEYFGSPVVSYSWDSSVINTEKARHLDALHVPDFLTSLDSAIALTERLLPEAHGWQFTIYHDGAQVSFLGRPPTLEWGRSKSRPRALLAATLRAHAALKAKETSDAE